MNTIQMECFIKAAETQNFTAAAKELYITQPTFSRMIAQLEEELEIVLFVRDRRHITHLTAAGESLYKDIKGIYKSLQKSIQTAKKIDQGYLSELRIGLLEGHMIEPELKKLFDDFEKANPEIEITYGRYGYLLEQVRQGKVDIGISLSDTVPEHDIFEKTPLLSLPTLLTLHKDLLEQVEAVGIEDAISDSDVAELAEVKKCHSLKDFKDLYFINNMQQEFCVFNEKLQQLCRASGFVPKCLEAPNLQTQILWVEMGRGIAGLDPLQSVNYAPDIVSIPVKEYPDVVLSAVCRKDNQNPAVRKFITFQ